MEARASGRSLFEVCDSSETAQKKAVQNATEIAHCTGKALSKPVLQKCRVEDRTEKEHVFRASQNQTGTMVDAGCTG